MSAVLAKVGVVTASQTDPGRPLRADALNNRNRLLSAARDVFVELGPNAPLEEISRRAGTGIATLYRRFPDRHALMRAVVADALRRTTEAARAAANTAPDPFAALTTYMHQVLEIRVSAVIPQLLNELSMDEEEIVEARGDGVQIIQGLIENAKRAGLLRQDVTFGDIGTLLVRLSRPLPGAFTREVNDQLAHRHLDLLINGLRAAPEKAAIDGPALTYEDLQHLRAAAAADD